MGTINRSSIVLNATDDLQLNTALDIVPNRLKDDVQPVFEVNPKITRVFNNYGTTSSGAATVYTTPTSKDFYLTFIHFAFTKDAACDLVLPAIAFYVDGAQKYIYLCSQTLTAESRSVSVTFPYPIKITRNTTIQISGAFTVGTCRKDGAIGGYILE